MPPPNRQLAAILFTDIVGYTSMMQQNEQNAVMITKRYVAVLNESVTSHGGEILNDYGDGSLCTFTSATQAVRCAIEMQRKLQAEPMVPLRIGLHIGEIFFEDGKIFGDGVNIASRIQSAGIANSILFSSEINSKLKNQQEFNSISVGRFHFKNIDEPMEVFALQQEGLVVPKREQMEGKLKKDNSSKRKIAYALGSLLLLVAGFMVYRTFFKVPVLSGIEKSVAIIPFKVGGNSDDGLGDGLVEDILAHLMKIRELRVISNKSSIQYADSKKSFKEIGEELKVNSLITGSIQQSGNRIRVSVQLVDSKTGDILWTDVYDRDKIQIFELQTELASKIVNALKAKLTVKEKVELLKRYTDNVEAYKFYRRGRALWDKRTKESYDSAEVNYNRAIDLDPEYALAYSGIADCYIIPMKGLPQLEAIPIAKTYAMKALSLDSTLSEALTTLGFIQSAFDYDWKASKKTLETAIGLNPNYPIAHIYYGNLLQYTNQNSEEGLREIKKALNLDPLSPSLNWVLGRNYYFAHQYDSAYEQLKKGITLFPNYSQIRINYAFVLVEKKLYSEAIELCKKGLDNDWQRCALTYAYAAAGDTALARKELEKTLKDFPNPSLYALAEAYAGLKDYDQAITSLEKAYTAREINMYFVNSDPAFDPLKSQPRFIALLKKMNFI